MGTERLEAEATVPASTTYTACNGAQSSATSLTATAGATFLTTFLADMQTQLNLNVQGFPRTATATANALGYGTWTSGAGYLLQESSGNPASAFGSPATLTATSLTYQNAGTQSGDYAIGFDAIGDNADGGANFDVGANDLIVAYVGKFSAVPTGTIVSKVAAAFGSGWAVYADGTNIGIGVKDGVGLSAIVQAGASLNGLWHVGIGVIDRSTGKARFGTRTLAGTTAVTAESAISGNVTTAANFKLGQSAWNDAAFCNLSAVYVVTGANVATGLSANLSTALTSFANAINATWTVARSADDSRITIANSYWPSYLTFADTNMRSYCGFAYDFDYPQTPAQVTTALGGLGNFAGGAGYLCNEAAGNLASAFGTPATLTATSLTYSSLGARGGSDKAIGFDAGTDNASGGDVYDVTATDDLVVAWVGYLTGAPAATRALVTKFSAAAIGWYVQVNNSGEIYLGAWNTGVVQDFETAPVALPTKEWYVGIACIDRSTGKARVGTCGLRSGTTSVSAETIANANSYANAGNLRLGQRDDAGVAAATESLFSAVYVTSGASVATGLSANLATALSSFATYMKSQTGTAAAKGVYVPNCPIAADSDVKQAPTGDDRSSTISPTGRVYSLASSEFYRHRNVRFSHVASQYVWANNATYANQDWETFYLDTQLAHHSWFSVGSRVKVYWNNAGTAMLVGSGTVDAWSMPKCVTLDELRLAVGNWTGLVEINLGDLYGAT